MNLYPLLSQNTAEITAQHSFTGVRADAAEGFAKALSAAQNRLIESAALDSSFLSTWSAAGGETGYENTAPIDDVTSSAAADDGASDASERTADAEDETDDTTEAKGTAEPAPRRKAAEDDRPDPAAAEASPPSESAGASSDAGDSAAPPAGDTAESASPPAGNGAPSDDAPVPAETSGLPSLPAEDDSGTAEAGSTDADDTDADDTEDRLETDAALALLMLPLAVLPATPETQVATDTSLSPSAGTTEAAAPAAIPQAATAGAGLASPLAPGSAGAATAALAAAGDVPTDEAASAAGSTDETTAAGDAAIEAMTTAQASDLARYLNEDDSLRIGVAVTAGRTSRTAPTIASGDGETATGEGRTVSLSSQIETATATESRNDPSGDGSGSPTPHPQQADTTFQAQSLSRIGLSAQSTDADTNLSPTLTPQIASVPGEAATSDSRADAVAATTATAEAASASDSLQLAAFGNLQQTAGDAATAQAARTQASQTPASPKLILDQVKVSITKGLESGEDSISIRLRPSELGRIDVHLTVKDDGTVQAVVVADRQDTLNVLKQDAQGLEKALQDAGLNTGRDSLSFSLRNQEGQTGGQNARTRPTYDRVSGTDGTETTDAGIAAYAAPSRDGGIDIRV